MIHVPAPVRRSSDLDEFLARPQGTCLFGTTFAYYFVEPGFTGFSLWGIPTRADIEALNRAMDVVLGPHGAPHLSLIDTSALRGVDPGAFQCMVSYLARRFGEFKHVIRRQALVRPGGLVGSVVAGFYAVLNPPYPVAVFTEVEPALGWLGCVPGGALSDLLAELRAAAGDEPLLAALRRDLAQREEPPTLEQCAHNLAVSCRTLQRRLSLCGTTYGRELKTAQVRRAQMLMLDHRYSLSAVAFEVGCSSPQRFSTLFKDVTGMSPSDWLRTHDTGPEIPTPVHGQKAYGAIG